VAGPSRPAAIPLFLPLRSHIPKAIFAAILLLGGGADKLAENPISINEPRVRVIHGATSRSRCVKQPGYFFQMAGSQCQASRLKLVIGRTGYDNSAGLRQLLQTGGDVHTLAKSVLALDNHIAEIALYPSL
jgi:hypothetical protein